MDCSCDIPASCGEMLDCVVEKIKTARKEHTCCECLEKIQRGEKYEYISGIWDGHWQAYKTCLDCKSLRTVFFNSWSFTEVWTYFEETFGYDDSVVPESCIAELTIGARAQVCEWIEESWGDEE